MADLKEKSLYGLDDNSTIHLDLLPYPYSKSLQENIQSLERSLASRIRRAPLRMVTDAHHHKPLPSKRPICAAKGPLPNLPQQPCLSLLESPSRMDIRPCNPASPPLPEHTARGFLCRFYLPRWPKRLGTPGLD
ncbi:hypothetical protein ACQKWADRAFT_282163 [Trichoderma austrokoningii]